MSLSGSLCLGCTCPWRFRGRGRPPPDEDAQAVYDMLQLWASNGLLYLSRIDWLEGILSLRV